MAKDCLEDLGEEEDNIKTDIKEIGGKNVDWILLFQSRDKRRAVVKMVVNFWAQ